MQRPTQGRDHPHAYLLGHVRTRQPNRPRRLRDYDRPKDMYTSYANAYFDQIRRLTLIVGCVLGKGTESKTSSKLGWQRCEDILWR